MKEKRISINSAVETALYGIFTHQQIHKGDGHYKNECETDETSKFRHCELFLDKVMIEFHSSSHHVEYLEYRHVWRRVRQLKIKKDY